MSDATTVASQAIRVTLMAQFWRMPPAAHVLASLARYHERGGKVTKSELVDQVADRAGLSKQDAGRAVDAVLTAIEDALRRGSEVSVSGFGKFTSVTVAPGWVSTRAPGSGSRSRPRACRASPRAA